MENKELQNQNEIETREYWFLVLPDSAYDYEIWVQKQKGKIPDKDYSSYTDTDYTEEDNRIVKNIRLKIYKDYIETINYIAKLSNVEIEWTSRKRDTGFGLEQLAFISGKRDDIELFLEIVNENLWWRFIMEELFNIEKPVPSASYEMFV